MVRLHFAYPWFKTYHFAPLYFNPLPPPPPVAHMTLRVSLTPFYSKLEHNTDRTTKIHSLFFTSPRNAKIIVIELVFWFFWSCFCVRVRFWLWVVLRHWIFKDRSSPGTTFLRWGFKFWAGVSSFDGSFDNRCLLQVEITQVQVGICVNMRLVCWEQVWQWIILREGFWVVADIR